MAFRPPRIRFPSQGPQGPQGPIGATGAAGSGASSPGMPLPLDPEEQVWEASLPGATGPPGAAGAAGGVGPAGPAGLMGVPGFDGPEGEPGADGFPGAAGAPGAAGPAGPTGPAGAGGGFPLPYEPDEQIFEAGTYGPDLTPYLYLPGRPSGQIAHGGAAIADSLTLRPNSGGPAGATASGQIVLDTSNSRAGGGASTYLNMLVPTVSMTSLNSYINVGSGQTISLGAGGGYRGLTIAHDIVITAAPNGVPLLVFQQGGTISFSDNTAVRFQVPRIFANNPTITPPDTVRVNNAASTGSSAFIDRLSFAAGTVFTAIPDVDIDLVGNIFTLVAHGMAANRRIVFGGTPPTPLVAGVTYYAVTITANTFQVALTSGGAAIDITALVGVNATTMQRGNMALGTTEANGNWSSFSSALPSVGAGWEVPLLVGLNVAAVTAGAGIIGTHAAIQIADLNLFPGTRSNPFLSLRSVGALVELRHVGPIVMGADATVTGATVGIEINSATRTLLLARQTTAQTAASTVIGGMVTYDSDTRNVKANVSLIKTLGAVIQTEIDFGTTPVSEATFTIADSQVSSASNITAWIAGDAPTGKDADEIGMDDIFLSASASGGNITLYVRGLEGYLHDKFKVNYMVG